MDARGVEGRQPGRGAPLVTAAARELFGDRNGDGAAGVRADADPGRCGAAFAVRSRLPGEPHGFHGRLARGSHLRDGTGRQRASARAAAFGGAAVQVPRGASGSDRAGAEEPAADQQPHPERRAFRARVERAHAPAPDAPEDARGPGPAPAWGAAETAAGVAAAARVALHRRLPERGRREPGRQATGSQCDRAARRRREQNPRRTPSASNHRRARASDPREGIDAVGPA